MPRTALSLMSLTMQEMRATRGTKVTKATRCACRIYARPIRHMDCVLGGARCGRKHASEIPRFCVGVRRFCISQMTTLPLHRPRMS